MTSCDLAKYGIQWPEASRGLCNSWTSCRRTRSIVHGTGNNWHPTGPVVIPKGMGVTITILWEW